MGIKMNYGKTQRKTERKYFFQRCEMKFFGSAVCKNNLLRQTKAVTKTYSSYLFPKTFLLSHPTSGILIVSQRLILPTFVETKVGLRSYDEYRIL